jgi:hypothetical protein
LDSRVVDAGQNLKYFCSGMGHLYTRLQPNLTK